ncbi:MdtA/MuxA family multidrug efflux RND transporter periplasmic adaptor subunit [Magnetospira thiophila]
MKLPLKYVLPPLILGLAVVTAVVLKATKPTLENQPVVERSWPVATVVAQPVTVTPEIRVYGEIVSGRDAEMRPLVAGRIVEMGENVVEGGSLKAGDLLIAIDPFDYQAAVTDRRSKWAEAQARQAELEGDLSGEQRLLGEDQRQLKLSRTETERRERLLKTGAGTQKALDDARLSLSTAEQRLTSRQQSLKIKAARVEQARAAVEQAAVALSRAERDLLNTRLLAPHDGFLKDVNAAVGRQVSSNDRVASLIAADRMEARFLLSDRQFARVLAGGGYEGRPVRIIWTMGRDSFPLEARLERTEGQIDATSGGVWLRAVLGTIPEGVPLRPGAFVQIGLRDQPHEDVISLPEQALHDAGDGGRLVYVATEGRLVAVPVEVATSDDDRLLVRGDFDAGAMIVTTRFPQMGPGVRVDPVKKP